MKIPDLRDNPEITTEHCSVLLEKLGVTLEIMYDDESLRDLAGEADAAQMASDLGTVFSVEQFHRLFQTELGKGLLVGVFFNKFVLGETIDE